MLVNFDESPIKVLNNKFVLLELSVQTFCRIYPICPVDKIDSVTSCVRKGGCSWPFLGGTGVKRSIICMNAPTLLTLMKSIDRPQS